MQHGRAGVLELDPKRLSEPGGPLQNLLGALAAAGQWWQSGCVQVVRSQAAWLSMANYVLRLAVLVALVPGFAGCVSSDSRAYSGAEGPPFESWVKKALAQRKQGFAYEQFSAAYFGDPVALKTYFDETLRMYETPWINAERSVHLRDILFLLLERQGDVRFSKVLSSMPPRTVSAVNDFMASGDLTEFPSTQRVLKSARKFDFPLNHAGL